MNARASFEAWLRSEARVPARKAGTDAYEDEFTQNQWMLWRTSWNAAMAAATDDTQCWLPRTMMQQIHLTLEFYANSKSYESVRSGGLLQGLLWDKPPSSEALTRPAKRILAALQVPPAW